MINNVRFDTLYIYIHEVHTCSNATPQTNKETTKETNNNCHVPVSFPLATAIPISVDANFVASNPSINATSDKISSCAFAKLVNNCSSKLNNSIL